jgi:hypothetical protein
MIDFIDSAQRHFDGVHKGEPDVAKSGFELRKDGSAEGLGRDSGTVRNEEYSSIGHDGLVTSQSGNILQETTDIVNRLATYNAMQTPLIRSCAAPIQQNNDNARLPAWASQASRSAWLGSWTRF